MLLAPGVHYLKIHSRTLRPARHTNVYVIGGEEVIIIDAGYAKEVELDKLYRLLDELGNPRVLINIISHKHKDHYSGVDKVGEKTGGEVAAHREDTGPICDGLGDTVVSRMLEGGEELRAGSKKIKVLHLPGHTAGMLNFFMEDEGLLFTSDNVVGFGTTWIGPPDGDMTDYLASLNSLTSMKSVKICPGHGPIIENPPEKIEQIIKHRLQREKQILDLIRGGLSDHEELFQKVYVKGEKIHEKLYTVARRTMEGHLAKLRDEGKVTSRGEGDGTYYSITGA